MVSGSGSRDINKTLYSSRISVETLVCLILGCHNYTSHYAAAASLFCRKIYKISAISASRVFRILWSWKFAQISSAIKLRRWLLSCEFQFILVLLIIFSSLWTQWQWLETEQLSCRRLEDILSCLIIKPRICTSNASSSLFRALLISIDQMGLVTQDCFKQSPQKTQVS